MYKRAFSLVEVLVSITLFSIILIFLYDTLDITAKSNHFYSEKLEDKQKNNNIKKIIFSDFINKDDNNISIVLDKNKNSILSLSTNNTYHNPFHNNITYLITQEDSLVRIESKKKFDKKKLNDDFFDDANIDILDDKIKKLKIKEEKKKIYFYLEYKDKTKMLFSF